MDMRLNDYYSGILRQRRASHPTREEARQDYEHRLRAHRAVIFGR